MEKQKITRTVKKKFQQIDKAGKLVKGSALPFGFGFFMAKNIPSEQNPKRETDSVDNDETENYE